jgi:hypothetical protein
VRDVARGSFDYPTSFDTIAIQPSTLALHSYPPFVLLLIPLSTTAFLACIGIGIASALCINIGVWAMDISPSTRRIGIGYEYHE